MPPVFDTGLDFPQRTLVRRAIVEKLGSLLTTANTPRYLAAIKRLPREIKGEGDADGLDMVKSVLAGKAPSVLVGLGRLRGGNSNDPTEATDTLEVLIYVVSSHMRDIVDGRLEIDGVAEASPTADPGIEVILEHVRQLLRGQALVYEDEEEDVQITATDMMRFVDEDEVATFADFTIWSQRYSIVLSPIVNPNRDEAEVVTSIEGLHVESGTAGLADDEVDIKPLDTIANLDPET